jgi:hypothetical protein
MKVELEQQVVDFVRSLAPKPRQLIRRSLKNLENETGDGRSKVNWRAFTGCECFGIRIIFFHHVRGKSRTIRCVYAAPRVDCL